MNYEWNIIIYCYDILRHLFISFEFSFLLIGRRFADAKELGLITEKKKKTN